MTGWQQRAACRGHDPRLWDSDTGIVAQEIGKAVCVTACPVRDDCAKAGRDEPESTWGGIDATDRLALMLLATPEPVPHAASRSCYVTNHCQRPECADANRQYIAAYRARETVVTGGGSVAVADQLTLEIA